MSFAAVIETAARARAEREASYRRVRAAREQELIDLFPLADREVDLPWPTERQQRAKPAITPKVSREHRTRCVVRDGRRMRSEIDFRDWFDQIAEWQADGLSFKQMARRIAKAEQVSCNWRMVAGAWSSEARAGRLKVS